jgi:uncharacterized protein YjbJ (UPF0337 family)
MARIADCSRAVSFVSLAFHPSPHGDRTMNKDQATGHAKDIAGKVQRKVGEMTGDTSQQIKGGAKQVEGKLQKSVGDAKQLGENAADESR